MIGEVAPVADPLAPPSPEVQLTLYGVAATVVYPAAALDGVTGVKFTLTEAEPAVTDGAAICWGAA